MKKILLSIAFLFGTDVVMAKTLVVYYSASGNTREIANQIKDIAKADIFEIQPVDAYPAEYRPLTEVAKKEIEAEYKPAIKSKIENIADYDVVFVGSPCWWSTIAPPVATFLSEYDLSGKTIVPFMTHEGSGLGRSVSDIKKLAPSATILSGRAFRGSDAKSAKGDVAEWLEELNLKG
jgi:flavodoxin